MTPLAKIARVVILPAVFCPSGAAHAADCLPPGPVNLANLSAGGSGGTETLNNAGQGNFACTDITSAFSGKAMEAVSIQLGGIGNPDTWGLVPGQFTQDGLPVTGVKYVFATGGQGSRCLYKYDGTGENSSSGAVRAGANNLSATACADGEPLQAAAEPTLPITTAGEECTGEIRVGDDSIFGPEDNEVVVVAESLDGQKVAACAGFSEQEQAYCADQCLNFRDVGQTEDCLSTASNHLPGELKLDACKPCDTALDVIAAGGNPPLHPQTGDPMEFCWEKVNSVYEDNDLAGTPPPINGMPRTPGTILKHTPLRQTDSSTTFYNACSKTRIAVNGVDYWVTTCK
jgi:hypothetical protein